MPTSICVSGGGRSRHVGSGTGELASGGDGPGDAGDHALALRPRRNLVHSGLVARWRLVGGRPADDRGSLVSCRRRGRCPALAGTASDASKSTKPAGRSPRRAREVQSARAKPWLPPSPRAPAPGPPSPRTASLSTDVLDAETGLAGARALLLRSEYDARLAAAQLQFALEHPSKEYDHDPFHPYWRGPRACLCFCVGTPSSGRAARGACSLGRALGSAMPRRSTLPAWRLCSGPWFPRAWGRRCRRSW